MSKKQKVESPAVNKVSKVEETSQADARTATSNDTAGSTRVASTSKRSPRWLSRTAMLSGILAFLFFVLTPLLPVKQVQSSFDWPQNGSLNSVNAPLISLAPESMDLTIPLSVTDALNPNQTNILSTLPQDSTEALDRGLFITVPEDGGLTVSSLNEVIFELTPAELDKARKAEDAALHLSATGDGIAVEVPGTDFAEETDEDMRPQLTGIYSELSEEQAQELIDAGLTAHVDINSRFTSELSLIHI